MPHDAQVRLEDAKYSNKYLIFLGNCNIFLSQKATTIQKFEGTKSTIFFLSYLFQKALKTKFKFAKISQTKIQYFVNFQDF